MNEVKFLAREFWKALSLYSKVFVVTIVVSTISFYMYGLIKTSHIVVDVVVTTFAILSGIIVSILSFFFVRLMFITGTPVGQDVPSEDVKNENVERVKSEIQDINRGLLEIIEVRTPQSWVLGEEWNRCRNYLLIEYVDPSPGTIYRLLRKAFPWNRSNGSRISEKADDKNSGSASASRTSSAS